MFKTLKETFYRVAEGESMMEQIQKIMASLLKKLVFEGGAQNDELLNMIIEVR
jgi:hypothetical protein